MCHLPRVEITRVSPRDYLVNLALARANNSSTLAIDSDVSANVLVLRYARNCRVRENRQFIIRCYVQRYRASREKERKREKRADHLIIHILVNRTMFRIGNRNILLNFYFYLILKFLPYLNFFTLFKFYLST